MTSCLMYDQCLVVQNDDQSHDMCRHLNWMVTEHINRLNDTIERNIHSYHNYTFLESIMLFSV